MASYYDQYFQRQQLNRALNDNLNGAQPNYNNPRITGTTAARNTPAAQTSQHAGQGFGIEATDQKPNGGIDASGIGGAVTGGLATIGMGVGIANEGKNIDTSVAGAQTSATGAPVYNLGGDVQRLGDLNPKGASFGQVLSAAGSGASAGSALAPGIGTAIGAIGGALTSLIGGRIKKRRMQEAKDKLAKNVARGQADYNEADQQFDQAQIRKQEFNKRRNLTNRLYNLYGAPKYNYG